MQKLGEVSTEQLYGSQHVAAMPLARRGLVLQGLTMTWTARSSHSWGATIRAELGLSGISWCGSLICHLDHRHAILRAARILEPHVDVGSSAGSMFEKLRIRQVHELRRWTSTLAAQQRTPAGLDEFLKTRNLGIHLISCLQGRSEDSLTSLP